MAMFEYSALTGSGRAMTGRIEAGSTDEAQGILTEMGLKVNEIAVTKGKPPATAIGRNEFLLFNQQLASLTKAGIPLERGLKELAEDVSSASMRKLIKELAEELAAGVGIDKAIEKKKGRFPALYSRILKAGVKTGRLSEMLQSLNRNIELSNRTRRIIAEAMTYPAVVLAIGALIITFAFIMVVPAFAETLKDMAGGELPLLTIWFLKMAEHVWQFWTVVIGVIAVLIVIWVLLGTSAGGRRFKESACLSIPLVGRIIHRGILSRMAEAMAVLVGAGCTMPECLRLGADASGSEKTMTEAQMLAVSVEEGKGLLESGQFCKILPRVFLYSVQLGSQRNELEDNLHGLARMYGENTLSLQARLQAVLLPMMIVCVGMFIGTMVLAMFLPMVKITTVMM